MREKIILASGINGDELLRSLASNGVNCFNVRIMNAVGLARYALMKAGVSITAPFVSQREETTIVSKAIKESSYFSNATYADIVDLTNAIRAMRGFVDSEDEGNMLSEILPKGIFTDKNNAILSAYNKYTELLEGIDSIGFIRMAMNSCEPFEAEFVIIKELPLKPLEMKLLNKLSNGKYTEISLADLYNTNTDGVKISSYKNCYGAPNEIEDVLTEIYSVKQLDKCLIAAAEVRTYSQILFDLVVRMNLPITFGCGIAITNANPARLLRLYNSWMTTGLFSAASLDAMISSDAFDRKAFIGEFEWPEGWTHKDVFTLLGQLKLSNNVKDNMSKIDNYISTLSTEEVNEAIEAEIKRLAIELALPCEEFVSKYSKIRPHGDDYAHELLNHLDSVAASIIYNSLAIVRFAGIDQQAEDVISDILSTMVCCQRSEPGKIHLADISAAVSSIRENIYVVGLSANNYPGTPKENYLLLDEDLKLFGNNMERYTSNGKIIAKKDRLLDFAKLAAALGCELHISYAGFNVSELKNQNASSMVFDLYKLENGDSVSIKEMEEHITKVEYFAPRLDATREIGKAYNEGVLIEGDEKEASSILAKLTTDGKSFSPSALSDFFECRRKYMYKRILDLPEDDEDKPFEVISAIDQGLIAHNLMEKIANSSITRDEFLTISEEAFENYLKSHSALIPSSVAGAKEQFMDMMGAAYDEDPHRKVVLKEEDIECKHEVGISIHGFPDRVEQIGDSEYIIVDFKTGRRVKHVQDDIYSCLQVVIYAYLMEYMGYHITRGEFRYLRLGQTVTCQYDANMKLALNDMLVEFMEAVKHNDYPCTTADDKGEPCKYCSYARLCNRVELEGDD